MPYRDPDRARCYQRDYRRLRRAGDGCTTPVHPDIPPAVRLKTAADVLALLEEQVSAVRAAPDAGPLEKARTVGFLAGVALRTIESGDLAARLEAVEAVLKARREAARDG
jgi:hypothetical protein